MNDILLWMRAPKSSPGKGSPLLPHRTSSSHSFRQPSIKDIAHGRLASRMKLQSTWEGIFEKFSSIPYDEANIINLDTREIEVNNGHLESLPDSELWYPHDSEQDDDSIFE